ncbi:MAG: succinate dehydrogenase, partial [Alphaproteobacteria bacterium]|nr:succinate dehydrogenase [Alphaproteobacteria bacterium]
MLTVRLYMLQRVTALLMAPLVVGHIGVMIYAVQGGLSAAEILGRTQGSVFWFSFYG